MPEQDSSSKPAWTLSREAFNKLLAYLDADPRQASLKYEQIRRRLIKMFQWRGCHIAEECADRSIDRVARRVAAGEAPEIAEPWAYFHGVALNILREHWQDPRRREMPIEELRALEVPFHDPDEMRRRESARQEKEQSLACLERCLGRLPVETQTLVARYHREKGGGKIRLRKLLAQELNIPLNALRIRLFRIRSGLAECVETCVKAPGAVK